MARSALHSVTSSSPSCIWPSDDPTLWTHICLHVWPPHLCCFFHPCLLSALQAANTWSVYLLKPRLEPSGSRDQQNPSRHFQSHRGLCTVLGMWEEARKVNSSVAHLKKGFLSFSPLCPITSPLHSRTASTYKLPGLCKNYWGKHFSESEIKGVWD